jgi:hypothetical protein
VIFSRRIFPPSSQMETLKAPPVVSSVYKKEKSRWINSRLRGRLRGHSPALLALSTGLVMSEKVKTYRRIVMYPENALYLGK